MLKIASNHNFLIWTVIGCSHNYFKEVLKIQFYSNCIICKIYIKIYKLLEKITR